MSRTRLIRFVVVMCFMAVFPPSVQALTWDSTYYAVVRERDAARRERDEARAERNRLIEMLRQPNPEIQNALEDGRKTIASVREELLTEQRTSATLRSIAWSGIPLGLVVGLLAGTAIGSMARKAHAKQQTENSPPSTVGQE